MTDGVYEWLTPGERAARVAEWNRPASGAGSFDELMRRWAEQSGLLLRAQSPETAERMAKEQHRLAQAAEICDLVNAARPHWLPRIDLRSVVDFLRRERRPDKELAAVLARVAERVGYDDPQGILFLKRLAGIPF